MLLLVFLGMLTVFLLVQNPSHGVRPEEVKVDVEFLSLCPGQEAQLVQKVSSSLRQIHQVVQQPSRQSRQQLVPAQGAQLVALN